MVLMAIDHAGYFIARVHVGEFWGISLPVYHSALPFLTRFVTHFCAPGFFFIMGIGMSLLADARYRMGWSKLRVFRHFAVRGAILIMLQLFLEDPAWMIGSIGAPVRMISPPGGGGEVWFHFGVLYALGSAMIVCGLLLYLRPAFSLLGSLAAMAVPLGVIPLLDADTLYSPLLRLLVIPGQTNSMQVFYPLLPWAGITGVGVVVGKILPGDTKRTSGLLLVAGIVVLIGFGVLRAFGWGSFHQAAGFDWMGFFNLTKYPPSLPFMMMTMGGVFLGFFIFSRIGAHIRHPVFYPLHVFGRAALFFYIAHLYLYALIGLAFPHGARLALMYVLWAAGLLLLLPLCAWYAALRQKTAPNSIWRFF